MSKTDTWVKSWSRTRIPFTSEKDMKLQEKGLRSFDSDKEVSVSLEPDSLSKFCGLIIIPIKERKKPLKP